MKSYEILRSRLKKRKHPGSHKTRKSLRVTSSLLVAVTSFGGSLCSSLLTTITGVEAHLILPFSNQGTRQRGCRQFDSLMNTLRGGTSTNDKVDDEEKAELDAYIEELLNEVDDDDDDDNSEKEITKVEKDKASTSSFRKISEEVSNDPLVGRKNTKTKSKTATKSKPTKEKSSSQTLAPKSDAVEKKRTASEAKKVKAKASNKSKVKASAKQGGAKKSVEMVRTQDRHGNPPDKTVTPEANATAATVNATTTDPLPPSESMTPRRRPPPPPNAFYRFLLRRAGGFGGRSTVLLLMATSEFLHTYLPPLAHTGDWVMSKVFPASHGGRRRRRPDRPTSSSINVASVSRMARTGVSRSKRRKFTQQADQQALAQLHKRPVSELRYSFCSQAFCQRHGLGKWASVASQSRQSESTERALETEEEYSVQGTADTSKARKRKKKKQDWVLAALAKEPRKKRAPTLTLDVGSGGLTVGVELDYSGQKERVRAALTLPSKRPKTSTKIQSNTTPRKSDVDGGMVGRLRAAAGSSMARSLSGAYPGDALPVDAAGNSLGLADFASKYGYGDWSENDDGIQSFGTVGSKRRRRRRKPRKETERDGLWDDADLSFSRNASSGGRRRRSSRTSRPEIALSSSPTLSRKPKSGSSSSTVPRDRSKTPLQERSFKSPGKVVAPRKVETVKSPLTRTNDLKKRASQNSNDED